MEADSVLTSSNTSYSSGKNEQSRIETDESKIKEIVSLTKISDPSKLTTSGLKENGEITSIVQYEDDPIKVTLTTDKGLLELRQSIIKKETPFHNGSFSFI